MDKVLSGKPIAALIKKQVRDLIYLYSLEPRMCLIQLGADPAADYYVQNLISNSAKLGCIIDLIRLPLETTQEQLSACINSANSDPHIHGIMIQKPLPKHIDDAQIGSIISPEKDLDCLNPINLGKIILAENGFLPGTPLAVLCTLIYYQIPVAGSHTLIIGRSSIVGKPLANMLLWKKDYANASVTICHSRSQNLEKLTSAADIVIAAIGQAEFVKSIHIKENSVLIDVGINTKITPDGKQIYVGDIDYNSCFDKALAITPVPGGIGTVTTALLFLNLVKACLDSQGINKSIDDFIGLIFNDK